ncbi:Diphthamide synthase [uncultured archaeon]|nr:Diphthamide synthase [uncultured archaeon]
MRVSVLFSGGKDSAYALYWALNQGWDVAELLTLRSGRDDSYMFHVPCVDLTPLQAKASGLPHRLVDVSGVKEDEVDELIKAFDGVDVDGFVSGALASEYQRTRLERVGEATGLKSFTPLWHKDPRMLLLDMIRGGFDVRFSAVAAEGFTESWAGRRLDESVVEELVRLNGKFKVHVGGEGGEYESVVLDAPFFSRKIEVSDSYVVKTGPSGYRWMVKKAALIGK